MEGNSRAAEKQSGNGGEKRSRTAGKKAYYRRHSALAWLFSAVIALAVAALLFGLWLTPARIAGDGMEPALSENEIVLIDRLARYERAPARGDLVALVDNDGNLLILRVVALAGETVRLIGGGVYIDDCPLDESAYKNGEIGDMDAFYVPDGCVFLLNDKRDNGYDSRYAAIGAVPLDRLTGALRLRVFPLDRLTLFG